MTIASFDHVAIPTNRPEALIEFYGRLGFLVPDPSEWRALGVPFFSAFFGGNQKINFHAPALWQSPDFELRGPSAEPGCGDFCFVWDGDAESLTRLLEQVGAPVTFGPVVLHGARGEGTSTYTRDPDGNLLEFIRYEK